MAIISNTELHFGTTVSNMIVAAANRSIKAIPFIPVSVGRNAGGPLWNVEGTGITTSTHADGSTFSTPTKDVTDQATLGWGNYETVIQVNDETLAVALNTGNPAYGMELMRQVRKGVLQHMKTLEQAFFTGSGSNSMIGLTTGVDDSSTYAGIAHTNAYWKSIVNAGAGPTRALTKPLFRDFIYSVAENSSGGGLDNLLCFAPFKAYNQLIGLWDSNIQFTQPANSLGSMVLGTAALTYSKIEGVPTQYIFDTDGYASNLNATIYCIDRDSVSIEYMPYAPDDTKVILDNLPMGIQLVNDPTGGHSTRVILRNKLQLKVANPQACGKLTNIATL